ncbi:C40 family peptidase [Paractinoplanes lichenicola]|uniref:C40 family peptidase n=1 Tax=Paractinoplanes lichenicola TaxID=2802976 RepID=A0ABS1VVY0_9ACTN|nr:NlpC/P60 family protein [Actinoplanes lichenicola]MBL7258638.1 C40 family peptidase [Actinoplanes lichenicola]
MSIHRKLLSTGAVALAATALTLIAPATAQAALPGCLAGSIVDMAPTPTGNGYWLTATDGGVFSYGDARFYGSMGGKALNKPMVAVVPTGSGSGYWTVAADGGVFAYGDAVAPASNPLPAMAGRGQLVKPIVEATRIGANGLLLVAGDGGVFALGGAPFFGSMGGKPLNKPMVDIVASPTGRGYATVAADGGVFAFGDYRGPSSNPLPGMRLAQPVTAAARDGNGFGLLLTAGDGGVFALGGATFRGSAAGRRLGGPITGIAADPRAGGYWLAGTDGGVFAYGAGAGFFGNAVSNPSCSVTVPPAGGSAIVRIAEDVLAGRAVSPWRGGSVPYVWGGGHGSVAGPSTGTCDGYTGSIKPCPATKTVGVDCSGFTRWVYRQAYGVDVLGGGNTNMHLKRMKRVTAPQPGDLVYFGSGPTNTTHVAIFVGAGRMIEAPQTGMNIRKSSVSGRSGLVGYYRY